MVNSRCSGGLAKVGGGGGREARAGGGAGAGLLAALPHLQRESARLRARRGAAHHQRGDRPVALDRLQRPPSLARRATAALPSPARPLPLRLECVEGAHALGALAVDLKHLPPPLGVEARPPTSDLSAPPHPALRPAATLAAPPSLSPAAPRPRRQYQLARRPSRRLAPRRRASPPSRRSPVGQSVTFRGVESKWSPSACEAERRRLARQVDPDASHVVLAELGGLRRLQHTREAIA